MKRVQVNYDPTPENLRTTESPTVRTQRAAGAEQRLSGLDQLIGSLATHYPSFRQLQEQWQKIEKDQTQVWAESMSTQELADKVRSGEMPFNNSPIAVATAQHVYGRNRRNELENDILSKLRRGELKFNSQEELDEYLSEQRASYLDGESKYTAYGFDKGLAQTRSKIMSFNTQLRDDEAKKFATQQLTQGMVDTLRNPDMDDKDKLESLKAQYQMFHDVGGDDQARKALGDVATVLSSEGAVEQLEGLLFLDPGDGLRVENFIGLSNAQSLRLHALNVRNTRNREEISQASIQQARSAVEQALRDGRYMSSPQQYYIGKDGSTHTFNGDEYATQLVLAEAGKQGWTTQQRLSQMERSGLIDPHAAKLLKHTSELLYSYDQQFDGKDAGVASEELQQALAVFGAAYEINPAYAKRLLGDDKAYEMLEDFHYIATDLTGGDVEEAARQTYLIHKDRYRGTLTDKKADELADNIFSESSSWFDGNSIGNIPEIREQLKRRIKVAVGLGVEDSTAQQIAVEHIKRSYIFSNGWFYAKKDIPKLAENVSWEAILPDLIDKLVAENGIPKRTSKSYSFDDRAYSVAVGDTGANLESTSPPDRLFENGVENGEKAPYVYAQSNYILKRETGGYFLYSPDTGERRLNPKTGTPIIIRDEEITRYSFTWRDQKLKEAKALKERKEAVNEHFIQLGGGV